MKAKIDWSALGFLGLTPLFAIILWSWHFSHAGLSWSNALVFLLFSVCCAMSITAGYHRLYAHQTYKAKPLVHYILFFFGTASFQGSILKWATDHRRHHRKIDSNEDPYSITKGFWYAHFGWMLVEEADEYKGKFERDLESNRLIKFQHDHYPLLALLFGFGTPTLLGFLYGDPLGGFIYGGLIRTVFNHHTTFLVNSLAHTLGKQTYSKKISARDSWIVALLTYGEGYHNFHHTFEGDYRNGIRWYHFDPTKWVLWLTSKLGGVYRLQETSWHIIYKAQIKAQVGDLETLGVQHEIIKPTIDRLEDALQRWRELSIEYKSLKSDLNSQRLEQIRKIKFEMNLARHEFKKRHYFWKSQWRILRNSLNVGSQRA